MSQIKAVVHVINSRSDAYGNRYFAFIATRTQDGATATGIISGDDSNLAYAMQKMFGGYGSFILIREELPIRQWERKTKSWQYAGCTPDEINPFILTRWNYREEEEYSHDHEKQPDDEFTRLQQEEWDHKTEEWQNAKD